VLSPQFFLPNSVDLNGFTWLSSFPRKATVNQKLFILKMKFL